MRDLLIDLCSAKGVSGAEDAVSELVCKRLRPFCNISKDKKGNVVASMGDDGKGPHLVIDAHMDQIGLIVTDIDDEGFLKVDACGGVDARVLPGCPVKVLGKKEVMGVVCCIPPHLSKNEGKAVSDISQLSIDVGMNWEKASHTIELGSRISFAYNPHELSEKRLTSPSLDNRASVAALIRCAEILYGRGPLPCQLSFLFSVQEETNAVGAATGAFHLYPDEAVVVDVSFAEQMGVPKHQSGKLGGGPMIGIAPCLSRKMTDRLLSIAERCHIPYTMEVMGGNTGTNADQILAARTGIPTANVSIPLRYMHTPVEMIDFHDLENTAQLLAEYVIHGGTCHV